MLNNEHPFEVYNYSRVGDCGRFTLRITEGPRRDEMITDDFYGSDVQLGHFLAAIGGPLQGKANAADLLGRTGRLILHPEQPTVPWRYLTDDGEPAERVFSRYFRERRRVREAAEAKAEPDATSPAVQRIMANIKTTVEWAEEDPNADSFEWAIEGFAAYGCITFIGGEQKGSGKSSLVAESCVSVLTACPFIERHATQSPVVYLTEEPKPTFIAMCKDYGLWLHPDFHVLRYEQVMGESYRDIVMATVIKAKSAGARYIATDTFSKWANLSRDDENGPSAGRLMIDPWRMATREGIAVVGTRHIARAASERSLAMQGQGNVSIEGSADHIFILANETKKVNNTHRTLDSLGRFRSFTPTHQFINRTGTPGDYRYVVEAHSSYITAEGEMMAPRGKQLIETDFDGLTPLHAATDEEIATLREVMTDWMSYDQIVDATGWDKNTVVDCIRDNVYVGGPFEHNNGKGSARKFRARQQRLSA